MKRQSSLTATWLLSEEKTLAKLLGLSLPEYLDLSHSGLREVRDHNDAVLYYYIIISPLNTTITLAKLNMNKSGIIYLPVDYRGRKAQIRSLN